MNQVLKYPSKNLYQHTTRIQNIQKSLQPSFNSNKSQQGTVIKTTLDKKKQVAQVQNIGDKKMIRFNKPRNNYIPGAKSVQEGFNSSQISINLTQSYEGGDVLRPIVKQFDSSILSSMQEQDTITIVSSKSTIEANTSAFKPLSEQDEFIEVKE